MSVAQFSSTRTVKAGRKAHRCEFCGGAIEIGAPSVVVSGVFDGDFYSCRGHQDCEQFWHEIFPIYGDQWTGMAFDLIEVMWVDATAKERKAEADAYRDKWPHVIARLEYRVRKWDAP